MDNLKMSYATRAPATGTRPSALIGVVASGNLEILIERKLAPHECIVEIATPIHGYDEVWKAVVEDFVERTSPGGLHISINDGGARPDIVALRLMQGVKTMEANHE
jgi:malonate decarboxylase delta subunit